MYKNMDIDYSNKQKNMNTHNATQLDKFQFDLLLTHQDSNKL